MDKLFHDAMQQQCIVRRGCDVFTVAFYALAGKVHSFGLELNREHGGNELGSRIVMWNVHLKMQVQIGLPASRDRDVQHLGRGHNLAQM